MSKEYITDIFLACQGLKEMHNYAFNVLHFRINIYESSQRTGQILYQKVSKITTLRVLDLVRKFNFFKQNWFPY